MDLEKVKEKRLRDQRRPQPSSSQLASVVTPSLPLPAVGPVACSLGAGSCPLLFSLLALSSLCLHSIPNTSFREQGAPRSSWDTVYGVQCMACLTYGSALTFGPGASNEEFDSFLGLAPVAWLPHTIPVWLPAQFHPSPATRFQAPKATSLSLSFLTVKYRWYHPIQRDGLSHGHW